MCISRPIGRRAGGPARCKARSAKEIANEIVVGCAMCDRNSSSSEGGVRACRGAARWLVESFAICAGRRIDVGDLCSAVS